MRHDLEAFLIQSAYLEGLLKYIADFELFRHTDGKSHTGQLLGAIKKDIEKYSLASLIDLLKRGNVISGDQRKSLDEYRQKRNKVLHDLLSQATSDNFEQELVAVYELGEKITSSQEFKEMEKMLDEIEKGLADKQQANLPLALPETKSVDQESTDRRLP